MRQSHQAAVQDGLKTKLALESENGTKGAMNVDLQDLQHRLEDLALQQRKLTLENEGLRQECDALATENRRLRERQSSLTDKWTKRKDVIKQTSVSPHRSYSPRSDSNGFLKSKIGKLQQEYNSLNQKLHELQTTPVRPSRSLSRGSPLSASSPSLSTLSASKSSGRKATTLQSTSPTGSSSVPTPSQWRGALSGSANSDSVRDRLVAYKIRAHSSSPPPAVSNVSALSQPPYAALQGRSSTPLTMRAQTESPSTPSPVRGSNSHPIELVATNITQDSNSHPIELVVTNSISSAKATTTLGSSSATSARSWSDDLSGSKASVSQYSYLNSPHRSLGIAGIA